MQQPTYRIVDNLRFTRSGTVWADFLIKGLNYGYRSAEDKNVVRAAHKMLWRALPGESLLAGLCVSLNPGVVTDRMMRGIDWNTHPQWVAECEATWDTLEEIRPGSRVYWLSVPLSNRGWRDRLSAAATPALVQVGDYLGMPRGEVPPSELARRKLQAERIAADIPLFFRPRPATAAQMVWMHAHCATRGLALDAEMPPAHDEPFTRPMAALSPLRIDEGAQSDRPPASGGVFGVAGSKVPSFDRVVKIDQPWMPESVPSYQSFLGLANTPSGDTVFPGSEVLSLADDLPGYDVDWVIRSTVRGRQEVLQRNRRALVNLNDQYLQRENEVTAGVSALDRAAEAMAQYQTDLESNQQEVEVEATALFAVGADTKDGALEGANQLAKLFENSTYELQCPLGFQEELFWAMTPGTPTANIVRQFSQLTTSHHISAWVPCVHANLGDTSGPLIALNITTNRTSVVHHDAASSSRRDVAGSIGFTGELGSGKSVAIKSIAGAEVDRGAQAVIVDRTEMGEYEVWASSIADARVVDCSQPRYSLDPLRMFDAQKGGEMALSLLCPLLHVQPDDLMGVLLSDVLDPRYRAEHGLGSLPDVLDHLKALGGTSEVAERLAAKMNVYASKSYTSALFARDIEPLDPASRVIVLRTHRLKLPSQHELEKQHLFEQLPLEKRVGRAMYQLVAEIARGICFANRQRFAIWVLDECHHVTRQEEGAEIIADFIRDGRKHNAAVFLGSHDPQEDFGNQTLRGLIPVRIVLRHRDEELAKRCLKWLGVDPDDQQLLKELTEDTSPVTGENNYVDPYRRGEGYMRDGARNIGRVKILAPSERSRFDAVMTTPNDPETVDRHSISDDQVDV